MSRKRHFVPEPVSTKPILVICIVKLPLTCAATADSCTSWTTHKRCIRNPLQKKACSSHGLDPMVISKCSKLECSRTPALPPKRSQAWP
eukprot:139698-Pelagomonas_calceolata.AAC.1